MKITTFLKEKAFKSLIENFKSLNMIYRIMFILGIILPFVLFSIQLHDIVYCYGEALDVVLKHGMKSLMCFYIVDRNHLFYAFYESAHPIIMLIINLIFLKKNKFNWVACLINIVMFCIASFDFRIFLVDFCIFICGGLG